MSRGGLPKLNGRRRNRYSPPSGPSYSVFARFRNGRIALARHFASLAAAAAFLDRARADRFHDAEGLYLVDDHSGDDVSPAMVTSLLKAAAIESCGTREPLARLLHAQATARHHAVVFAGQLDRLRSAGQSIEGQRARIKVFTGEPVVLPPSLAERARRCSHNTLALMAAQQRTREAIERTTLQLQRAARRVAPRSRPGSFLLLD